MVRGSDGREVMSDERRGTRMKKNVNGRSLHGEWETSQTEEARKRAQASSKVTRRGAVRRLPCGKAETALLHRPAPLICH